MRIISSPAVLFATLALSAMSLHQSANATEAKSQSYAKYQQGIANERQIKQIMAEIFPTNANPATSISDAKMKQIIDEMFHFPSPPVRKATTPQRLSNSQVAAIVNELYPSNTTSVRRQSPRPARNSTRTLSDSQVAAIVNELYPSNTTSVRRQNPRPASKPTQALSDDQVAAIVNELYPTNTTSVRRQSPRPASKPTSTLSESQVNAIMAEIFGSPAAPATPAPSPATPVVGNALVSWAVPRQREDGSNLSVGDIQGYEIYYTSENSGASEVIRINNSRQTQFNVSNLPSDSYHFSMVTIDSNGIYSDLSSVVSKTVN